MKIKSVFHTIFFLILIVLWNSEVCVRAGDTFDVTKYGSIADGKTDNSKAFLDAWENACKAGGTMLIPSGTFLVTAVEFNGGCNGQVTVQVNGVVKASAGIINEDAWFSFHQVDGLTITGNGTFDGNGPTAWGQQSSHIRSIAFYKVSNTNIQGITSLNSKGVHFSLDDCKTVTFTHVTIRAPIDSPNTDGIHIEGSDNVQIISSPIGTGDDCVSIGQGSTNINITDVNCGPGHGFSIGSIGKRDDDRDVMGVYVTNCSVTGTQNGVRIKTWAPSPSVTVSNVTFQDIIVNNSKYPIIIDQHYCGGHDKCHTKESSVQVSNVKFSNIRGISASPVAVTLQCSASKPCEGIEMNEINLSLNGGGKTTSSCENVHVYYSGIQVPPGCR